MFSMVIPLRRPLCRRFAGAASRSDQIGLSLLSPHASTCGMCVVHTLLTRGVTDSPARVVSELSSSRIRGIGVERGRADCLNEERMGTYQQPGGANEQRGSSASSVISAMELGLSAARSFNLVWGMGRRRWVSINSFEWRSRAPPRPTHEPIRTIPPELKSRENKHSLRHRLPLKFLYFVGMTHALKHIVLF